MAAPAAAADVDVSPADQDVDAFFATIDGEEEMQHEQAKRMYLAEREKRQQIQHMLRDALDAAEVAKRAQLAESEARVAAEKHTEELEAQLGIHALQRIASSTSEKALMEQVEVLHNQIAKLQAAMKKGRTEAQQRVQETLVEAERAHTERRKAQSERLETQHDLQDARDMVRPMKELLALPLSERVQTLESAYEACGGGSEETEARRLQELEVKAAVTAAEAAREKARAKAAELSELDKQLVPKPMPRVPSWVPVATSAGSTAAVMLALFFAFVRRRLFR